MAEQRLIDVNKLIDFIDVGHLRYPGELCYSEVDVANFLLHAPTVDAVPVVRCKDCKFGDWDSEPDDAMVCMRTKDGFWRSGNDFCSYGERKEGAN